MTVDPPIRCAVLVPSEFAEVDGAPCWALLHANCDVAEAREKAAEWSRENLGRKAVVMLFDDYALSGVQTAWAKP